MKLSLSAKRPQNMMRIALESHKLDTLTMTYGHCKLASPRDLRYAVKWRQLAYSARLRGALTEAKQTMEIRKFSKNTVKLF